jgi:1-acyl-sn-glycerol-3-phosphate acyltransferase
MKRETLASIIHIIMRAATRTTYIGMEHIPENGGLIIATNHMSRLDIPLLLDIPKRDDVTALVAANYEERPVIAFIINTLEGVWIDRSKADFTAFRAAAEKIKQGKSLGIAPEGTRSDTGELIEGKPGTVLLALKAGVPIVPVGIVGSEDGVRQLKHLRRPKMDVRFGPAFSLPPLDRDNRDAAMKKCTEDIMCRIAVLLPERYHGFYAGHPRLLELLEEQGVVEE